MATRILTLLITTLLLMPLTATAWWGGPGSGQYGAGPFNSNMDGNFSFGTSMRGNGRGYNGARHGLYRGYPPPPRPAGWHPRSGNWVIHGVNFKYDSAELLPSSMEILDAVANVIRRNPQHPLEVGGHASAEGDTPYNMTLSNRRAETVRAYLVARGVEPQLLTWRGYGESRPLANNMSEAGRRINRRVELMPVAMQRQYR